MKIKAILFGSTGMIGQGVLRECLADQNVEKLLVVNRQSCNIKHPKLREIIHSNMYNLSSIEHEFVDYNACLFCLGMTSVGMNEQSYHRITYELTLAVAQTLLRVTNEMSFCYISGASTDSSEKGKIMWARVKGKTENALLQLPFKHSFMFRPGYIQPLHGIKSKTKLYNALYIIFKPFYFILKRFPGIVTDTETLGKAMIKVLTSGYKVNILESKDINTI